LHINTYDFPIRGRTYANVGCKKTAFSATARTEEKWQISLAATGAANAEDNDVTEDVGDLSTGCCTLR